MAARFVSPLTVRGDHRSPDPYSSHFNRRGNEYLYRDYAPDQIRGVTYPLRSLANPLFIRHLPGRTGFVEEHDEPRSRQVSVERQSIRRMSFDRAMKKMHRQLRAAEKVYEEFYMAFENEVTAIRTYATPTILNELWVLKVCGERDRRESLGGESNENGDVEDVEPPIEKFKRVNARFNQSLETFMASKLASTTHSSSHDQASPRTSSQQEAARRLQEIVGVMGAQVRDLLQKASRERLQCDALRGQIVLLKNIIDPDTEGNRKYHRGREESHANGASDESFNCESTIIASSTITQLQGIR